MLNLQFHPYIPSRTILGVTLNPTITGLSNSPEEVHRPLPDLYDRTDSLLESESPFRSSPGTTHE